MRAMLLTGKFQPSLEGSFKRGFGNRNAKNPKPETEYGKWQMLKRICDGFVDWKEDANSKVGRDFWNGSQLKLDVMGG